jgi:hypothetical protein
VGVAALAEVRGTEEPFPAVLVIFRADALRAFRLLEVGALFDVVVDVFVVVLLVVRIGVVHRRGVELLEDIPRKDGRKGWGGGKWYKGRNE